MITLVIEPTNACDLQCLHCMRNKADPVGCLPLSFVEDILRQARRLGFRHISFTGGEIGVYPHVEELFDLCATYEFRFGFVTNGSFFVERIWPAISRPAVRPFLEGICFSLDGASPRTHDALRGATSFQKIIRALTVCKYRGVSTSLKTMVTNLTKHELLEIALLGAAFGVRQHGFLFPYPTPTLLERHLLPDPEELLRTMQWIQGSLSRIVRSHIYVEGYSGLQTGLIMCSNILYSLNVDYQGNVVICCNMSHPTADGVPSRKGREVVANLHEVPLAEAVARHFEACASLQRARAEALERPLDPLERNACIWCLKHFDKLGWLRRFPDSPWSTSLEQPT